MKVVGYTDLWTLRPGESVGLHVSCAAKRYGASIVRLRHGDVNPAGPGFKADAVPSAIDGQYDGRWHDVPAGSYARVENAGDLLNAQTSTVAVWVCPTLPGARDQAIMASGGDGFCLAVDAEGRPAVSVGSSRLKGPDPLLKGQWYLLVVRIDRQSSMIELTVRPRDLWPGKTQAATARASFDPQSRGSGPLMLAARPKDDGPCDHFNGKIDTPLIFASRISDEAVDSLSAGDIPLKPEVAWDFSADHASLTIPDTSGRFAMRLIGMPTRAVTGHRWNGKAVSPKERPDHYTAIHFHDDDRDDARWPEALRLKIPQDWPSGIYAFHLTTEKGDEDYVPFFLLPAADGPFEQIAFLAPTFSYLAYGNMNGSHTAGHAGIVRLPDEFVSQPFLAYIYGQRLTSCYDYHSDSSGVSLVSRLLPQVSTRPKVMFMPDGPHQLNADLHLVDWLHEKNLKHDVLTDEALDREGVDLLRPYNVILTGTHPEYWSANMLDALGTYLKRGGRLMYMGGNGFYWVTSVHPNAPHVLEIRKSNGTRTWDARPGERYHASTGEHGGLWSDRGGSQHGLLGVGMSGFGLETNTPFSRTEESHSEATAFMFEGIASSTIGHTPSLVLNVGAAGFEVDRVDFDLGSPPNTICVATSMEFNRTYRTPIEHMRAYTVHNIGPQNPTLRADMTYLQYPNGGAVFSVSSISYCGCLSFNNYNNDVSRLTENVVREFMKRREGVTSAA